MAFSTAHYEYDHTGRDCDVSLADGAHLFRVTTLVHCDPTFILNGEGPKYSRLEGRFNEPVQPTSYCANNALVALSEVMFHMYRAALDVVAKERDPAMIRHSVVKTRCLVAFAVNRLEKIVHLDSEDAATYGSRLRGTAAIHPDAVYPLYRDFNREARKRWRNGIMYPSARHSRDHCFALFDDQSGLVKSAPYFRIPVKLCLMTEDAKLPKISAPDPNVDRLSSTHAYYEVLDPKSLDDAKAQLSLHPLDLPARAVVDFVRRKYVQYPKDAVSGR